jgi:hypothetical protein
MLRSGQVEQIVKVLPVPHADARDAFRGGALLIFLHQCRDSPIRDSFELRGLHVVEGGRGIIAVLALPQTDNLAHIFGAQIAAQFNGCAPKSIGIDLVTVEKLLGLLGSLVYRTVTSMNDLVVGKDRAGRPAAQPPGNVAGNGSLETQGWFQDRRGAQPDPFRTFERTTLPSQRRAAQ